MTASAEAWKHLLLRAWTGTPEERADANRRMDNIIAFEKECREHPLLNMSREQLVAKLMETIDRGKRL